MRRHDDQTENWRDTHQGPPPWMPFVLIVAAIVYGGGTLIAAIELLKWILQ